MFCTHVSAYVAKGQCGLGPVIFLGRGGLVEEGEGRYLVGLTACMGQHKPRTQLYLPTPSGI
jgi:hypothetical protein